MKKITLLLAFMLCFSVFANSDISNTEVKSSYVAPPSDISLSSSSIDENENSGTIVGVLSTTDGTGPYTYALVAGVGDDDNASFTISGLNLESNAVFDFETKSSYSIRVRTTDDTGNTFHKVLTITINDINETPTDISLSSSTIDENGASGTTIGALSSADVDAGDTFTYSLVSGIGDTDNASFSISGSDLLSGAVFNHETKDSYSIRLRTTDANGLTYEEAFIITVNDINETPTDISLSSSTIDENEASGTTIGALSSSDVDAGDTFTYSLVSGTGDTDNGSFSISGSNLLSGTSFDHETKVSYSIRVRTTDANGLTREEVFTIIVNDINETPTDISLSSTTIDDDQPSGTTVGNLSSTDVDDGDTFTYSLVAGSGDTDNGAFSITGAGLLSATAFDYNTKASYSIRVRTTDSGSLTFDKEFTISVNDKTPPVISNVTMVSNNTNTGFAKEGDVITLSFTSDETLVGNPTVTIATETASVSSNGNNYTATLTVGATTTEGSAAFLISSIADDDNNAANDVSALSSGNAVTIDRTAPTGYGINALTNPVNPAVVNISSFAITGLEANSNYNWSITDSSTSVSGNGTSASGGSELISNINLSGLNDGTLTLTVYSTDQAGNQGANVTDTTTKDTQGPVIVLAGDNPQILELNNIYVEQGVTSVNDNIDGALDFTNDGGTIDTSALDNTTVGRYNIVYSIVDSRGNTGTATRVVHVMDNVPTTVDDTFTVNMNSSNNNLNVLGNDCFGTAGPNTTHSLTLVNGKTSTATANGNFISVNNNGTPTNYLDDYVSYTPTQGFTGADSFTYTITDVNGIAATATVNITVSAVALGYTPDTFTVLQDSNNNELDVMANDTDDAGFGLLDTRFLIESVDHLTGTTEYGGVVTLNTKGTANDTSDDVINYTPRTGFFGTDTFRYVPGNDRNTYVLVTVTVTEVITTNGTPTAVADAVTVATTDVEFEIDVLGNDSPGSDGSYIDDGLRMPNGTFGGASTEGGLLVIDTKGTVDTTDDRIKYTPKSGFTGTDTFDYTITDKTGDAATATVTVTVNAVTDRPSAVDDTATVVTNSSVTIDILDNDTFGTDGAAAVNPIVLSASPTANGGTIIVNDNTLIGDPSDDDVTYTATNGFIGTDTFTYTLTDSNGDTSVATVTVEVTATPVVNGTPTAVDDTFTVDQDSNANLLDVLNNDNYGSDPANATHPLTFLNGSVTNASANGGAVSVVDDNGVNKISYTPVSGFSGTDTIGYTITDSTGDASSATVTVTVTSATSLLSTPTAVDDVAMTDVDTSETISVLANDTFGTDGRAGVNHLTVGANSTQGGTTVVNGDDIDYTPAGGFQGIDTFTYTIEDGSGDTTTATVTVTVGTPVTTPTAVDDTASVMLGGSVVIDVLSNDSSGSDGYIDGGLTFTNGTLTSASVKGGAIAVDNKNTVSTLDDDITYSPFKGAVLGDTDTFEYTITDATGDASTAEVTITITAAAGDVPTAIADTATTTEDVALTISVLADNGNGADSFGTDGRAAANHLTTGANSAQGGTTVVSGDDIIYTPATGFIGVDTFTYTIEDLSGDTSSTTVTVTVNHTVVVNGTPTANNDTFTVNRYAWTSADPVINLNVLADNGNGADDFGLDGAMTAHNALNLINGKLDEFSTSGRRIRIIDPNNTPNDYSDDQIAYYSTGNLNVTQDTFTYTITDNTGDAATGTVTINYIDVAPPKPVDDTNGGNVSLSELDNKFSAYPNPSSGNVTTTIFSTSTTKVSVSLYDVRGMEVYRGQLNLKAGKNVIENSFNVKPGVMFLKVYNSETNFGVKKIIFK